MLPMINGGKPFVLKQPEPAESCGKCRFSLVTEGNVLCRRHPPQVSMIPMPARIQGGRIELNAMAAWPSVQADGWCGEFAGKVAVASRAPRQVPIVPPADLDALRAKHPRIIEQELESGSLVVAARGSKTQRVVSLKGKRPDEIDCLADEAYQSILAEIAEAGDQ